MGNLYIVGATHYRIMTNTNDTRTIAEVNIDLIAINWQILDLEADL